MLIYNEFSSSLMLLVYDKFSDEFCYIIHDEFVLHSVMNLDVTNECHIIAFCDEFSDEKIHHRMSTTPCRIHVAATSNPRGDHVVATRCHVRSTWKPRGHHITATSDPHGCHVKLFCDEK